MAKIEMREGDAIEAYWPGSDEWLPATLTTMHEDGWLGISWEDGCLSDVPADYVRRPEEDEESGGKRTPGAESLISSEGDDQENLQAAMDSAENYLTSSQENLEATMNEIKEVCESLSKEDMNEMSPAPVPAATPAPRRPRAGEASQTATPSDDLTSALRGFGMESAPPLQELLGQPGSGGNTRRPRAEEASGTAAPSEHPTFDPARYATEAASCLQGSLGRPFSPADTAAAQLGESPTMQVASADESSGIDRTISSSSSNRGSVVRGKFSVSAEDRPDTGRRARGQQQAAQNDAKVSRIRPPVDPDPYMEMARPGVGLAKPSPGPGCRQPSARGFNKDDRHAAGGSDDAWRNAWDQVDRLESDIQRLEKRLAEADMCSGQDDEAFGEESDSEDEAPPGQMNQVIFVSSPAEESSEEDVVSEATLHGRAHAPAKRPISPDVSDCRSDNCNPKTYHRLRPDAGDTKRRRTEFLCTHAPWKTRARIGHSPTDDSKIRRGARGVSSTSRKPSLAPSATVARGPAELGIQRESTLPRKALVEAGLLDAIGNDLQRPPMAPKLSAKLGVLCAARAVPKPSAKPAAAASHAGKIPATCKTQRPIFQGDPGSSVLKPGTGAADESPMRENCHYAGNANLQVCQQVATVEVTMLRKKCKNKLRKCCKVCGDWLLKEGNAKPANRFT